MGYYIFKEIVSIIVGALIMLYLINYFLNYFSKKEERTYLENKESNDGNPIMNGVYFYGLDGLIESEETTLIIDDNLTITNENDKSFTLEFSKIDNAKVIDYEELKNSAFAINLGLVQALKFNKKKRKFLIILYDQNKKIIFDVTDSIGPKFFCEELLEKCKKPSKTVL